MLKRILFAVAPIVMICGTVSADDDLLKSLASMNNDSIVAVDADDSANDEDPFGQADVDALLGEDDKDEDAVAACFRRIGYGYGYSRYYRGYSYNRCYRPYYYSCYRPVSYRYCYPMSYHVPCYTSYWGCAW